MGTLIFMFNVNDKKQNLTTASLILYSFSALKHDS